MAVNQLHTLALLISTYVFSLSLNVYILNLYTLENKMAVPPAFGNWQEALDNLLHDGKRCCLSSEFQQIKCDEDRVKFIINKKLLL